MSLPIYAYGHKILEQPCLPVTPGFDGLEKLIADMWETMKQADGCGLAAPQVGHGLRLFVVDSKLSYDAMHPESRPVYFNDNTGIREVFINAEIVRYSDRKWKDEEACLSIPGLQVEVERPWSIEIEYTDEKFQRRRMEVGGITARMIQHEYDHTQGKLHIGYAGRVAKKMFAGKLRRIRAGRVKADYPVLFCEK